MEKIISFSIFIFILLLLDFYTFQTLRTLTKKSVFFYVFWLSLIAILATILYLFATTNRSPKDTYKVQTLLALSVIFYLPKLFLIIPLLIEDIIRIFSFIFSKIASVQNFYPSRRKAVSLLGLGLASIPFLSAIYGVFRGRFNYKLHSFTFEIEGLSEKFNGCKIIQLSDIHIGSFTESQKSEIKKGIDILNEQKADLVLFTGDLVNFVAHEIEPFIDVFAKIECKNKYSVFGNHDYGDYYFNRKAKDFEENKRKNLQNIVDYQKQMGFTNLRNASVRIQKENDFFNLIGVENWGKKGRFPQTGDLNKATETIKNGEINILMSHDPTHFDQVVKFLPKHIHLTLAGHTHGMQMGIELPFLKFSPVQFVYKKWAGLYEDLGRYLYVNRGFGFLAMPARIGIFPEITLITLKRK